MTRAHLVCAVLLWVVLLSGPVSASTISVPADYTTIQAAINAAANGDVVVVAAGTYRECINFNGKAITVQSTDPTNPSVVAATIIDGGGSTSSGSSKGSTYAKLAGGVRALVGKAFGALSVPASSRPQRRPAPPTGRKPVRSKDITAFGSVVTFANSETASSVLSGLTITGGVGDTDSGYLLGGGVYCGGASPTLTNNFIKVACPH